MFRKMVPTLFAATALMLSASLSAQAVGWARTYSGQPPSTANAVDVLPNGANFGSAQGSSGAVWVRPGQVSGASWLRVGNDCLIVVDGQVLGKILDYFNPRARIDHDGDWTTPTVPGGYTTDGNGNPAGYWVR